MDISMTLYEEMLAEVLHDNRSPKEIAHDCAQVAKRYIEKAVREAYVEGWIDRNTEGNEAIPVNHKWKEDFIAEFNAENGLTEENSVIGEEGLQKSEENTDTTESETKENTVTEPPNEKDSSDEQK